MGDDTTVSFIRSIIQEPLTVVVHEPHDVHPGAPAPTRGLLGTVFDNQNQEFADIKSRVQELEQHMAIQNDIIAAMAHDEHGRAIDHTRSAISALQFRAVPNHITSKAIADIVHEHYGNLQETVTDLTFRMSKVEAEVNLQRAHKGGALHWLTLTAFGVSNLCLQ